MTRSWRFDRMATVCHPGSGKVTASFAAVAKHYGVAVAICPPRRGNRKGVVEKANQLDRLHLVTLSTIHGTVAQRSATLPEHGTI